MKEKLIINDFVSVIIPIRNEEKYIAKCLDSVISQTYQKEHMEILLVDGISDDNTRTIINDYIKKYPYIKVFDNLKKHQAAGMNKGIMNSKGDIIIRLDAHTYYDTNYIARSVETLQKVDAHNVGGPIVTLPGDNTLKAKAIALATSHPFGVGNSKFRTSNKAEYVDTVAFGAFRREVFERVGLFNENLPRNQDIELNSRIRKLGWKIYLDPEIKAYYYNRSTLKGLWKQNFINGQWNIYTHMLTHNPLSIRHYVPFIFVSSLLCGLITMFIHSTGYILLGTVSFSYMVANIFYSSVIGCKHDSRLIPLLGIVFCTLHFSYGVGSFWGLMTVKKWKKSLKNNG